MEIKFGDVIYVVRGFDLSTAEPLKPFLAFLTEVSAINYCKKWNDNDPHLRMFYDKVILNVTDWSDEF